MLGLFDAKVVYIFMNSFERDILFLLIIFDFFKHFNKVEWIVVSLESGDTPIRVQVKKIIVRRYSSIRYIKDLLKKKLLI